MNVTAEGHTRLVIVGATGMVGGYALRYALDQPAVGRVTAIVRREFGISHPKLHEILHLDFGDCSALSGALRSGFEPGRVLSELAGFAIRRIQTTDVRGSALSCMLDLSRICHLGWSNIDIVVNRQRSPAANAVNVQYFGPSCYEGDLLATDNWRNLLLCARQLFSRASAATR
jgi:diaminopimelate decarboxylase